MVGMFWAEKYAMVTGLTLVVRKLFKSKGTRDMWLSTFTCTAALISMNLGAGLLYPYSKEQYLFGVAEGVFAGSTLLMLWMLVKKIRIKKPKISKEKFFPGEERISHYTKAFTNLAKTFLSVPSGSTLAVVGMDDYQKVHAAWNARMEEQRVAVATQLTEISEIMEGAVRRAYDTKEDITLERQLKSQLRKKGILLKNAYVYDNEDRRKEVYLTIRTKKKRSISNKEAAEVLSVVLGIPMMPSREARAFVRNEYTNTCFVERTNFEVIYGVERSVGDYQQISGDSFSFLHKEEGQFLASLSDGMGTGLNAYQESEKVIDLLEQFLEAGFSKETAVKMINSALVLRDQGKTFSTIDISSIDLYSGVCEFLKIGAATSFIRRGNWVETITSTSLPAGIFQQTDYEKTCRKLYDGDMVIMVTDGVLDVLPTEHQESLMKDIILEHQTNNPKELADYILSRVHQYKSGRFCDDMTILVVGIWKR
ncbi:MAG: SpoIIE family protein phosphatase [Lachnospiraceae bacterium]|nr:SpoIIE family protein phosphatase [Lachnospiraceae bacterium]